MDRTKFKDMTEPSIFEFKKHDLTSTHFIA